MGRGNSNKFAMGLFERPFATTSVDFVGCPDHRVLAAQAVQQSAVLLKNDEDLSPLPPRTGLKERCRLTVRASP
ncbi:hypothetical protein [Candidatus Leptofilum sp.]|uniref:hypothetical protein n=1 Tax=Candidatus Leptofilum sp. TaxID=3241576 RepID=UPI003B5AAA47